MVKKIKTFWLNIGFLDRDMDLSERIQILEGLQAQNVEVRANFNYKIYFKKDINISKVWYLQLKLNNFLGIIHLFIKQQIVLLKNLNSDFIVLTPFNLHQTLITWFLWKKILRHKKPKFVLDVRTLPVDVEKGIRGELRKIRFKTSVIFAYKYFDGLTLISKKMKDNLNLNRFPSNKKVCIWSSGVDPKLFNPNTSEIENLLEDDRFVVMYHGVFSLNRGLQQTIKAIKIVKEKYPKVLFFMLGKGPAEDELRCLINNLGLNNYVAIHSPVPMEDVPKYIKLAKAGILPFPDLDWWNTSSPIKLNEYLSMGKAVIVTDIAAHRNALGEIKCAFFIENYQPHNIAKGIIDLISKRNNINEFSKIARKHAIENYTWEIQAKKIKQYFKNLIDL